MTPSQAIDVLDQATINIQGTRKDHMLITQALEVLRKVVSPEVGIEAETAATGDG